MPTPIEILAIPIETTANIEGVVRADAVLDEIASKLESPEIQQSMECVEVPMDERVTSLEEFNSKMIDLATPEGLSGLSQRYPEIQEKIETLRSKQEDAEGPRDYQSIDTEAQQYRGIIAEDMVETSLAPNFDSALERQPTLVTDSGATRPDVVLENAQLEFSLGDLRVSEGENLYVEVKTGTAEYIQRQMDHILKQVEGHEGKSAVVVTREYLEIKESVRTVFEEELTAKDSHIIVLDLAKGQIDDALASFLQAA